MKQMIQTAYVVLSEGIIFVIMYIAGFLFIAGPLFLLGWLALLVYSALWGPQYTHP
jgi:hypothetical protein